MTTISKGATSCPACDDDGGHCVICKPNTKRYPAYDFITAPCERALLGSIGLALGLSDSHSFGYSVGIGAGVWLVAWPTMALFDALRRRFRLVPPRP